MRQLVPVIALVALLAVPASSQEKKGKKLPTPVLQGQPGKVYKHVIGFRFWHPRSWRVQEQADFLLLVPPNQRKSAQGPTEAYLIIGDKVTPDIKSAGDVRVGVYLDRVVGRMMPFMARQGQPRAIPWRRGQAYLYAWRGNNPAGQTVEAEARAGIIQGNGVALLAFGLQGLVAKRRQDLRRMFGSFAFGQGERDRAIVGRWVLRSTTSIRNESPFETDWSRARAVAETRSWLTLTADGQWTRRDKYHMLAGSGGLWVESKEDTVRRGTWNAGRGELYLMESDGTWSDARYRVDGAGAARRLRLVSGGRGEVWVPVK